MVAVVPTCVRDSWVLIFHPWFWGAWPRAPPLWICPWNEEYYQECKEWVSEWTRYSGWLDTQLRVSSLSDREKKVGLIMLTHICTYLENFVKIGPVYSEIIGLQGDR